MFTVAGEPSTFGLILGGLRHTNVRFSGSGFLTDWASKYMQNTIQGPFSCQIQDFDLNLYGDDHVDRPLFVVDGLFLDYERASEVPKSHNFGLT